MSPSEPGLSCASQLGCRTLLVAEVLQDAHALGGPHPMHACGVQMKEKYTKMRPYGEWLAEETVILQQIIDAVPAEQRQAPPVLPAGALPSLGAPHVSIKVPHAGVVSLHVSADPYF